jgi:hypothetical protein
LGNVAITGNISANIATFGAGSNTAPAITTTGDTNTGIFFPAADTIAFSEGGVEAMRIDSSGNVGIGVTPTTTLDVKAALGRIKLTSSTGTNNALVLFNNTGGNVYVGLDSSAGSLTAAYALNLYHEGAYPITFSTNNAERARIDSSGNLLVGTTSQINDGLLCLKTAGAGTAINTSPTSNNTYNPARFCNYVGNTVGYINSTTSSTSYNTSSDYRLKTNVEPMQNGLAKVMQLRPVTFNWLVDGSLSQGFIAHELQEVYPDAVTGEKDGEQMQGVDYGKLTPILTAALQEAIAKIETLEARIAVLEAK